MTTTTDNRRGYARKEEYAAQVEGYEPQSWEEQTAKADTLDALDRYYRTGIRAWFSGRDGRDIVAHTWLVPQDGDGPAELVRSTPPLTAEVLVTRVWVGLHRWEYEGGGNETVTAHRHTLVVENRKTRTMTVFVDVTGEENI